MTEETSKKGMSPRTWNAVSIGVFLIAIALGILIYTSTNDIFDAFWSILIAFGAYMALSSPFRKEEVDSFGPSMSDAICAGGVLLAGIGASGLLYSFTGEVLYTAVVIIVIVALVGIILSIKNRSL
ncbi:MAG: hypothetical protein J6K69_01970 [Candidatus Methanomethylophilaceae archaeon]|nr:hypothetical protein [Candidatus Methanomethylophilaceae archaeon]MBR2347605.1 hypothetical protein [Candidatus Methanomethylophilaceae archaeon]MBR2394922.1 hypothetical protein [Candidatus Methanomethylophilaceae archaeon]